MEATGSSPVDLVTKRAVLNGQPFLLCVGARCFAVGRRENMERLKQSRPAVRTTGSTEGEPLLHYASGVGNEERTKLSEND